MLHIWIRGCRSSAGQKVGRLDGDFMQHERTDDAVHCHHTKLLQVFCTCENQNKILLMLETNVAAAVS